MNFDEDEKEAARMKTQSFRPHALAMPRPSPLGSCPTRILTQSCSFPCTLPGPASALPTLCPLADSHSHTRSVLHPETPGPLSPTTRPLRLAQAGQQRGCEEMPAAEPLEVLSPWGPPTRRRPGKVGRRYAASKLQMRQLKEDRGNDPSNCHICIICLLFSAS